MKGKFVYFTLASLVLALLIMGILLKENDGKFNTKVTFSTNDTRYQLSAKFPLQQSAAILQNLKKWTNQATFQSGHIEDQLKLTFSDGSNCIVSGKGREIQIIATTSKNNQIQLARLAADYRAISAFIVNQARLKH